MAINEMIPLAGQGVELGRSALSGAVAGNALLRAVNERKNAPLEREAAQMTLESGKIKLSQEKALEQLRSAAIDGSYIRQDLASGDLKTAMSRLEQRNQRLLAEGRDNTHTLRAIAALQSGDPAQVQALGRELVEIENAYQQFSGGAAATDPRTNKMKELEAAGIMPGTPEYKQAVMGQTQTTKMRDLEAAGIMPGTPEFRQAMMGGGAGTGEGQKGSTDFVRVGDKSYTLGTVFNPQTQQWANQLIPIDDPAGTGGKVEFLGSSGVPPSQRPEQKYREATFGAAGEAAIKRSELYFDKVDAARASVSTIDEAIAAIDNGASTGVVTQYFPSLRQSSKQLDSAARRMGLNVVSAVTFGALSEGELALAMDTAMAKSMERPELRKWLLDRKNAQLKLAGYLESAAIYLGQTNEEGEPHTTASWAEMQKGKAKDDPLGLR